MGTSRHDRAMKRTNLFLVIRVYGLIFLWMWALLFLTAALLIMVFGRISIREIAFGKTLLACIPIAALAETVMVAVMAKNNPGKEFQRLHKEFGSDSDELYEYTLNVYKRYCSSVNKKALAAEWALKLAGVCLDRGRAGEALDIVRSADMTDYFKSPGIPGNLLCIINYFQLLIWIDIERNDPVSEEQHYAAGEEYFREIKKDSGFYPHVTVTRCDHMIFRGEAVRAIEILCELEEYLTGSSNIDFLACLHCRLGEAYLKLADSVRAQEEFDRALAAASPAEAGALRRRIERLTGNERYGVIS